jgi:predicted RND superfamily exporter protein/CRP-like cAMP-binding protein
MTGSFFRYLARFPKSIILISLLASIFFFCQIQNNLFQDGRLIINSSMEPFISRDSGTWDLFRQAEEDFGNDQVLVIAIKPRSPKTFDLALVEKINRLTIEIQEKVPEVSRVMSITNTSQPSGACIGKSYFHQLEAGSVCLSVLDKIQHQLDCLAQPPPPAPSSESDLEDNLAADLDIDFDEDLFSDSEPSESSHKLDPDLNSAPGSQSELVCTADIFQKGKDQLLREAEEQLESSFVKLKNDPFIIKDLLSQDLQTAGIIIKFKPSAKIKSRTINKTVRELLKPFNSSEVKTAYAGQLRQQFEAGKIIRKDFWTILPVSFLVIVLVLAISFQSIRGVIIPVSVVFTGIIWTAGIFALNGEKLNLVTMACSPILICVGSAYVIHIINQYYHEAAKNGQEKKNIISLTVTKVSMPLCITALTTIAGFAALTISPIPAIKELGLYTCIGISFIIFLSLTLAPALLSLFSAAPPKKINKNSLIEEILFKESIWIKNNSRKIIIIWIIMGMIAGIGIFRVNINSSTSNFKKDSQISQDLEFIQDNLAGINNIEIIFKGKESPAQLKTVAAIHGLDKLAAWLEQKDGPNELMDIKGLRIDKVYTPVTYIAYYQGLSDLSEKKINTLLNLKQNQNNLFYNPCRDLLKITIRMKISGSTAFLKLQKSLEKKLPEFLPDLEARFTGSGVLASESADNIARGQVQSISIALLIVFIILSILFLSFKMGLIALYPNLVAIALFFGTLGWLNIPIGITISMIASIALGIGVDDTIHFLSHFNENVKKSRDEKLASQKTVQHIGKPIFFTTLSLTMGFIVFTVSDMESQILFGLLTAFTLWICLITDLTFLPSIMMETKLITAWDYLDLHYDEKFLKEIEMFRGMTVSETKIATLMAYTVDLKKNEILFDEGDSGEELYLVLAGSVSIFLKGENREEDIEVVRLEKGATFGEMGLFRKCQRTAAVKAASNTSLLAISEKTLLKLQRRYPYIAARLYLNLARGLSRTINKSNVFHLVGGYSETSEDRQSSAQKPLAASIFEKMSKRQLKKFQQYGKRQSFTAGTNLFSTGDSCSYLMVILSGELEVIISKGDIKKSIAIIQQNDFAGEASFLGSNKTRQADIITTRDTQVLTLTQESLDQLLNQDKRLAAKFTYNMVSMLSDRLEKTTAEIFKEKG